MLNGTCGRLTDVDPAQRRVELSTETGDQVTLPAAYLDAGLVDHGYALTVRRAQGAAVDRVWLLGSDFGYRLRLPRMGQRRALPRTRRRLPPTATPSAIRGGPQRTS